jgi:hypothetical protein
MCGNIQVQFLRGKGAVRLPTYLTIINILYIEIVYKRKEVGI